MKDVKISVVTVCYNSVDTIEDTILSVLNQTYSNIEYIIIDGGSTDGTVDIIKKYADRLAYWVSEPDKGIYDAMNKGIAIATGEYIYFIGSDDKIHDTSVFAHMITHMCSYYNDILYGNVIFKPRNTIYGGRFSKLKLVRMNICHQAIFYPTHLLKSLPYDLKYKAYADYNENIILWAHKRTFRYIPLVICDFNCRGFSSGGDRIFNEYKGKIVRKSLGIYSYIYYLIRVRIVQLIKRMVKP